MVTHRRPRGLRAALTAITAIALVSSLALTAACDKVPLTAPTGSVITLFAAGTNVPLNGEIEIVATVIENGTTTTPSTGGTGGTGTTGTTGTTSTTTAGAGTPVQNGTLVSFTTTLGSIEPSEARTSNGQVRVKFKAGNQSGTVTITAFSGGASGKLENLKIGSAAAERVLVSASPQTLGPSGGTAVITARVEDTSGAGLAGVPVTFTTDSGTLTASTANTDQNGVATTTLNTTVKATVTANVAGKTATVAVNLNPRTGVTITAPTTSVSAGVPTAFTVGVSSTANIRDVVVDWGDASDSFHIGALSGSTTVPHTYRTEDTYTVRATAIDATGFSESAATQISVLPGQPPTVTITAPQTASVDTQVTVSANVTGATSTIIQYKWDFGPDAVPQTVVTSSRSTTVRWTTVGTKVFSVKVIQSLGPEGDQVASITIVR